MSGALREVVASFGVDFDKEGNLKKGHKHVEGLTGELAEFGKGLLAAFAVEKVFEFGHEILETADAVAKQSAALGISTEQLQGWQHAAQLSGSSAEEFTQAFQKFTRNVGEARGGAGPAAQALHGLGISFDAIKAKAPIDLLDDVVAGLQDIKDPGKRAAAVVDLFGKSGARLLPLLSEGPEGIKKLRAEVGELGATFDDAFLENAQEVNDNVDRLKLGLRGLAIQAIGPLLPDLVELSHDAIEITKSFIGWIKQTHITHTLVTGLAVKAIPLLLGGLSTLGAFALEVVAPFLLLDDELTFLAGGDSLIGRALNKVLGDGTAVAAREELLQWFTDIKDVVGGELVPALLSIGDSAIFKGVAKGALDGILAVLQAIGLALTDDEERANKLVDSLQGHLSALGLGPSKEDVKNQVNAGLPENRKPGDGLSPTEAKIKGLFTSIFGDPMDDPAIKAEMEKNKRILEQRRLGQEGAVAAPSLPPLPRGEIAAAFKPDAFGPPTAPDYASLFRPTVATAPAGGSGVRTEVTNNIAPVITNETHVTVEGGEDVGNRVSRAINKSATAGSMRGIKAGLVPTPGG